MESLTTNINDTVMMKILDNYKKIHALLEIKLNSLKTSLNSENKKGFFNNHWRFSKKAKGLIAFAIIIVILVSIFAFLPKANNQLDTEQQNTNDVSDSPTDTPTDSPQDTPQVTSSPTNKPDLASQISISIGKWANEIAQEISPNTLGILESAKTLNSSVWKAVASNAWHYFDLGIGVIEKTGLPGSGDDFSAFTDWDLGVYIQAIMDANSTGLIGNDGAWGSSARLEKVVWFLEHRELNSTTNYPYWFYQAKDGSDYHANSDIAGGAVNVVDTGRLFVALDNLRAFNNSLAQRINDIVLHGRSNYAILVPDIKADSLTSTSIYAYYIASGFASFWPNELSNAPNTILNNIFASGNVTTKEGVSLPKAELTGDPLFCSFFELRNNDPRILTLVNAFYLAHEAYYNSTGKYRAFSEGQSSSSDWVWEWVIMSDGKTWVTQSNSQNTSVSPTIFTKIAFSFLATYNTTYAMNMSVYLEKNLPESNGGFYEGVDESGNLINAVGCNSNGLILEAALYGIRHYP